MNKAIRALVPPTVMLLAALPVTSAAAVATYFGRLSCGPNPNIQGSQSWTSQVRVEVDDADLMWQREGSDMRQGRTGFREVGRAVIDPATSTANLVINGSYTPGGALTGTWVTRGRLQVSPAGISGKMEQTDVQQLRVTRECTFTAYPLDPPPHLNETMAQAPALSPRTEVVPPRTETRAALPAPTQSAGQLPGSSTTPPQPKPSNSGTVQREQPNSRGRSEQPLKAPQPTTSSQAAVPIQPPPRQPDTPKKAAPESATSSAGNGSAPSAAPQVAALDARKANPDAKADVAAASGTSNSGAANGRTNLQVPHPFVCRSPSTGEDIEHQILFAFNDSHVGVAYSVWGDKGRTFIPMLQRWDLGNWSQKGDRVAVEIFARQNDAPRGKEYLGLR